jgi:hypothetical protein
MKKTFVDRLTEILVKQGTITAKQAQAYRHDFEESSKEVFDDFLLEEGLILEEDLLKALSSYYQVPATDVMGFFFDRALLQNFPKDFLIRNGVIPLEMEDDILIMVASDPSDLELEARVGAFSPNDIQFYVGLRRDIEDAIKEFYDKSDTEVDDDEDLREEHDEFEDFEKKGEFDYEEE